jgi:hypothetical protein
VTFPLLGSPLRVGPLRLRNRVVAAPMERNYADRGGRSTARYEAYLRARARAARRLRLDLVDVVDVSAGCYEAGEWMVQPGEVPRGVLAPAASAFRTLGKPVCVAGRIPTGDPPCGRGQLVSSAVSRTCRPAS